MLSIAGQTALPNWLKFMGGLGFKKLNFFKIILLNLNFFQTFISHGQHRALQLVVYYK